MKMINEEYLKDQILGFLQKLPEPDLKNPHDAQVKEIIRNSALKSSSLSAALAIPGGVVGLASVIPDILAVWRIQSQMISNIAASYNKEALIGEEQMLWCMFRQFAVGLGKEIVVQQGTRFLIKKANNNLMQNLAGRIGQGILKTHGARLMGRVVPLVGSVTAGAITYYDTYRVGKNALQMYSGDIVLLDEKVSPKSESEKLN